MLSLPGLAVAASRRGRTAARAVVLAGRRHLLVSGLVGALGAGILAGGLGYAVSRTPAAATQAAAVAARPLAAGGGAAAKHPLRRAFALRALIGLVARDTHQTRAQVLAQLRAGRSLDQIAGSQAATVRQQVIDRLTARLQDAVKAKRITQAQADRRLSAWKTALAKLMAAPGTSLRHPAAARPTPAAD